MRLRHALGAVLLALAVAGTANAGTLSEAYAKAGVYLHNLQVVPHRSIYQQERYDYWGMKRAEYAARLHDEQPASPAPLAKYTQDPLPPCVRQMGDGTCAAFNYLLGTYKPSTSLPTFTVMYPTRLVNDGGPVPAGKLPVFVAIPGGPLPMGVATTQPLSSDLVFRGAVVFLGDYRSQRQYGGGSPQAFQDVGCEIRAARALAPLYGGDPSRVTLLAHSFGGFISNEVILGNFAPGPDCKYQTGDYHPDEYVSVAGVSSSDQVGPNFLASDYPDAVDIRAGLKTATRRIPVVVIQGQIDTVANLVTFSKSYASDLAADGWSVTYVPVPAYDHSGILDSEQAVQAVLGAK